MRARRVAAILCLTLASSAFVARSGEQIQTIIDEPCPIGAFAARMGAPTPLYVNTPKLNLDELNQARTSCVEALDGINNRPPAFADLANLLVQSWPDLEGDLQTFLAWEVVADHDLEDYDALLKLILAALAAWLEAFGLAQDDSDYPLPCKALATLVSDIRESLLDSESLLAEASLSSARTLSGGGVSLSFGVAQMEFDQLAGEPLPIDEQLRGTVGVLSAGVGLVDRFDLSFALPLLSLDSGSFTNGRRRNVGDMRLDGKFQVKGRKERLGLALQAGITAPTGDPDHLMGSGEWSGRIGAVVDRVVGRADDGKAILTPHGGAWLTTRDGEVGYGLRAGLDSTWNHVTLLVALTGAVEPVRSNDNEYLDGLIGVRVRLSGDPARDLGSRKARVDGSLIYTRYLTDNGAIPSDGYFSLALRTNW
jgi:hypothetical protein